MSSADRLVNRGHKAMTAGEVNRAAEFFNQALIKEPRHPGALLGMARCLIVGAAQDKRLAARAETLLSAILASDSHHGEALVYMGLVHEIRGRMKKARKLVEQGIREDPSLFVGHFNLGRIAGQIGDWPTAVLELEKATTLESGNPQAFYSLGIARKESGDLAGAIGAFRKFVELDPTSLDGYITLVDVLGEAGEMDAVWETLERARVLFGDDPNILDRQLGLALRTGRRDQAIDLAARLAENDPRTWLNVSGFALRCADYVMAERAAMSYVEAVPEDWRAYYHLALVYDEQGQLLDAEPHYRKALDLGPDQWEPCNNLGFNLITEDDAERVMEGVELLKKARDLSPPQNLAPRYNLALGLQKIGDVAGAVAICREGLEHGDPNHPIVGELTRLLGVLS